MNDVSKITIDDVRQSENREEALASCDDATLDRLAGEVQGWELKVTEFPENTYPLPKKYPCWIKDGKHVQGVNGSQLDDVLWRPSRDLNTAYLVMNHCLRKLGKYWDCWACVDNCGDGVIRYQVEISCCDDDPPFPDVILCQQESHPRAVTIVAILGILAMRDSKSRSTTKGR